MLSLMVYVSWSASAPMTTQLFGAPFVDRHPRTLESVVNRDRKLKHLDFIQGVINRLSTNSFLLKGWSVVLVSALFALSASDSNMKFVVLAYFPAISFWALDGYFFENGRKTGAKNGNRFI